MPADNYVTWFLLGASLPDRLDLFAEPGPPRPQVLAELFRSASEQPGTVEHNRRNWSIAGVEPVGPGALAGWLFVALPNQQIFEKIGPNQYTRIPIPAVRTRIILYPERQVIAASVEPQFSQFARSAPTMANVLQEILQHAFGSSSYTNAYEPVLVEPLIEAWSFVRWWERMDYVSSLTVVFPGRNMPGDLDGLVPELKDKLAQVRELLGARKRLEAQSKSPELSDEKVEALGRGVAERQFALRASGIRSQTRRHFNSRRGAARKISVEPAEDLQYVVEVIGSNLDDQD